MAEPETETEPDTQRAPKKTVPAKRGARASIQVDDIPMETERATSMLAAASGRRRDGGEGPSRADAQKFSRAIRDPNNKIIAQRVSPPAMADGTALGDMYEVPTHESQSESEIKKDITEARGARKWILRVYDPDDNIIASKSIEVGGVPQLDPLMAGLDVSQEEEQMQTPQELTEEEMQEREISRDPEIIKARKNLRLKQLQNDQEEEEAKSSELRARRVAAERAIKGEGEHGGNGNGKPKHGDEDDKLFKAIEASTAPLKAQNEALQKRLEDTDRKTSEKESREERRRELEAMVSPLKDAQTAQQRSLEALLSEFKNEGRKAPTGADIQQQLNSLKTELQSNFTQQVQTAVNSVRDGLTSKIDALTQTINLLASKGKDPAVSALIALATSNRNSPGGAASDPFQGLMKAMEVMMKMKTMTGLESQTGPSDFPSFLVDKMAEMTPEVLNFFREQRGAVPTKEELDKMMRATAMKMYEGIDESMKKNLNEGFQRLQQGRGIQTTQQQLAPGSAPQQTNVSVAPAETGPSPHIVAFPGASPAAAPAPAPTATPQGAATLTPEALWKSLDDKMRPEYIKRVNWVLNGMLSEMQIGMQDMQWPEKARGNLPKAIVDQIVEANSDEDIHRIVKPYADQAILSKIWAYLSPSNPQYEWYQNWLAQGINWIKQAEGVELVEPGEPGEEPVVEDAQ